MGSKIVKTYTMGNRDVTTAVSTEGKVWEKGENKREYFTVETISGDSRKALDAIYMVLSGTAASRPLETKVTVDGVDFVYSRGVGVDSNVKRETLREVAMEIIKEILAAKQEAAF